MPTIHQVLEALLFASQKALMPKEILTMLRGAAEFSDEPPVPDFAKLKEVEVVAALLELQTDYRNTGRAFQLNETAAGWQVVSRPDFSLWVRQLYPENRPTRLSAPALETLAIIAYRQPITKADVEAVRGVAVDGVLQTLLDRGLVRIAGRAEVPGRPLLYETSTYFLDHFQLKSVDELPNSAELRRIELPKAEEAPVPEESQPELTVNKPKVSSPEPEKIDEPVAVEESVAIAEPETDTPGEEAVEADSSLAVEPDVEPDVEPEIEQDKEPA